MKTIEAIKVGSNMLRKKKIPSYILDSELLMSKTINKPRDIKKSGICLPLVSLSFFAYELINNMQIITAKIE